MVVADSSDLLWCYGVSIVKWLRRLLHSEYEHITIIRNFVGDGRGLTYQETPSVYLWHWVNIFSFSFIFPSPAALLPFFYPEGRSNRLFRNTVTVVTVRIQHITSHHITSLHITSQKASNSYIHRCSSLKSHEICTDIATVNISSVIKVLRNFLGLNIANLYHYVTQTLRALPWVQ